jgi:hypothetical protein
MHQLQARFGIEKFVSSRCLNRVYNFATSNNIRTDVPVLFVKTEEDMAELNHILAGFIPDLDLRQTSFSYYIIPLDIILINVTGYDLVDYMTLGLNYIQEFILLHELVHATNPWRHLYYTSHIPDPLDVNNIPPYGFYWGNLNFLEESYAVYWEIKYVKYFKSLRGLTTNYLPINLANGFIDGQYIIQDFRNMYQAERFVQSYTYLRSGAFLTSVINKFPMIIEMMHQFRVTTNCEDLIAKRNALLSYLGTIKVDYPDDLVLDIQSKSQHERCKIGCVKTEGSNIITYTYPHNNTSHSIDLNNVLDQYTGPWSKISVFEFYKQRFLWAGDSGLPSNVEMFMIMFEYQYT